MAVRIKKIDACYEPPAKLRFLHIRAVESVPEPEYPHKHSEAAKNAHSFSWHAACAYRHQLALSIRTPTPGTLISVLLLLLATMMDHSSTWIPIFHSSVFRELWEAFGRSAVSHECKPGVYAKSCAQFTWVEVESRDCPDQTRPDLGIW
jgi:hypothetical protein